MAIFMSALRAVSEDIKRAVQEAATICPRPLQVDIWPFDLESGVRVTCDVGYLCANFGIPIIGLSVLDLGPMYATDRQTSDAHHRLMPPPYRGGA